MPYGYGQVTFTTSGDIGGGRNYTRIKGPLLAGQVESTVLPGAGAPLQAPHLVNVSTARADLLLSVISTATIPSGSVGASSALNVSTGSPSGLVYISMTTGTGNLIAAGSTANAPVGLPGGANGVALVWDAAANTLALY